MKKASHYLFMAVLAVALLLLRERASRSTRSRVVSNLFTPKFWSSSGPKVLNVHVVPHTHDDVGWLKTVEQYYYGKNQTIQGAFVKSILTTTLEALLANPNRTFTYVETKFFSMWWNELNDKSREKVRSLVHDTNQLSFVNGGWCMHDEATTHYMGMIDQTTLGHAFLKDKLNFTPTVGWQLDPFGHSSTQSSYMSAQMGFDALYFGRIDYQDLVWRQQHKECEGIWAASSNNPDDQVFWGLTGEYNGNYGPPEGFCFDIHCDDEKLIGMDDDQLQSHVTKFVMAVIEQANRTKDNHVMLTMGEDFNYEQAQVNFANNDLLIHLIHKYQEAGSIDVSTISGGQYETIQIFYSTPNFFTAEKKKSNIDWAIKTDDFFPYADHPHAYWTGYFVSRTGFKRHERVGSSFLLAARQVESLLVKSDHVSKNFDSTSSLEGCPCCSPLYELEDALGVSQHHDAVSGTAKQHVANDYARRLQSGINRASAFMGSKIKSIILEEDDQQKYFNDITYCQLLNETICTPTETASETGDDVYLIIYNALAQKRSTVLGVPVQLPSARYLIKRWNGDELKMHAVRESTYQDGKSMLYFETGELPPLGAIVVKIEFVEESSSSLQSQHSDKKSTRSNVHDGSVNVTAGDITIQVNASTGQLQWVTLNSTGVSVGMDHSWGYYVSYDASNCPKPCNNSNPQQNSGAYIFRPQNPDDEMTFVQPQASSIQVHDTDDVFAEVAVTFEEPWIQQIYRIYKTESYVEVEYTVGPIPMDDGRGKEVVTRYTTAIANKGVFYTDSNGREFQRRIRSQRPSWNLTETEPVAGNYYPINAAIYLEDHNGAFAVATDRSQGGSSVFEGSLELMVHRRTLKDDSRGVAEAMNETTGGVTPYPPYGSAERVGEGIVVRGKHRLMVGAGFKGASLARSQMDAAFSEPVVFAASSTKTDAVSLKTGEFSLIEDPLPPNVMLLTYSLLRSEVDTRTYMIRLGHQYGDGEDKELSNPTTVCLGKIMHGQLILSLKEKTLSGNQDVAEKANRISWNGGGSKQRRHRPVVCDTTGCMVHLEPMQIRTFEVTVGKPGEKVYLRQQ